MRGKKKFGVFGISCFFSSAHYLCDFYEMKRVGVMGRE